MGRGESSGTTASRNLVLHCLVIARQQRGVVVQYPLSGAWQVRKISSQVLIRPA